MTHNGHLDARTLHARLNHPVIDADGHWLEYSPVLREECRRPGGDAAVERPAPPSPRMPPSLKRTAPGRTRRPVRQPALWPSPRETVLDRATAMVPRLMHDRVDGSGIDLSVVYPTAGRSYHR